MHTSQREEIPLKKGNWKHSSVLTQGYVEDTELPVCLAIESGCRGPCTPRISRVDSFGAYDTGCPGEHAGCDKKIRRTPRRMKRGGEPWASKTLLVKKVFQHPTSPSHLEVIQSGICPPIPSNYEHQCHVGRFDSRPVLQPPPLIRVYNY